MMAVTAPIFFTAKFQVVKLPAEATSPRKRRFMTFTVLVKSLTVKRDSLNNMTGSMKIMPYSKHLLVTIGVLYPKLLIFLVSTE